MEGMSYFNKSVGMDFSQSWFPIFGGENVSSSWYMVVSIRTEILSFALRKEKES